MAEPRWTYMFRILRRNPDQLRMDRVAKYMAEFAGLLGLENEPVFKGIKKASTGLKAAIPPSRRSQAWLSLQKAKTDPSSKPAKHARALEELLSEDQIKGAQLLDSSEKVVQLFTGIRVANAFAEATVREAGTVDGMVVGLVGADDTMHLHVRDAARRDLRLLVTEEAMARDLLSHFRSGILRFTVMGSWQRTPGGWIPETSKCLVQSYEVLDESSLRQVFSDALSGSDVGWASLDDPLARWRDIRGVQ